VNLSKGCNESVFLVPGKPRMYSLWQQHINRYIFAAGFARDKVVLDVACGAGYGSDYLIKMGAKKVVGGDISEDAIEYARAQYKSNDLQFVRLNAVKLPFSRDCFDAIVSFETIEHLKEYENFLFECKRVLKDKGLFICSTPNKWHVGDRLSSFPMGEQLKSVITKFIFRQNRRVTLGIETALDGVLDKRYEPTPLQGNPLTPTIIIALATVDKAR